MLLWAHYAKVSNIFAILCMGVYSIYPCGEGGGGGIYAPVGTLCQGVQYSCNPLQGRTQSLSMCRGGWGSVTILLWAHYGKVSNIVTILCRGVCRIDPFGEGGGWGSVFMILWAHYAKLSNI